MTEGDSCVFSCRDVVAQSTPHRCDFLSHTPPSVPVSTSPSVAGANPVLQLALKTNLRILSLRVYSSSDSQAEEWNCVEAVGRVAMVEQKAHPSQQLAEKEVVGLILVDSVSVIQKKNQMEIFGEKQIQKARCWQDSLKEEDTGRANLLI